MKFSDEHEPTPRVKNSQSAKMAASLSAMSIGKAITLTMEGHETIDGLRSAIIGAQKEFSPNRKFSTRKISHNQLEVERKL